MAYFAEINEDSIVVRVLRVPDEQEHRGSDYLAIDCNLGGTWIQTSYNNNIRGKFAGLDYIYDAEQDIFIEPCPVKGYILQGTDWIAPTPRPEGDYVWDTITESWVERSSLETPEV